MVPSVFSWRRLLLACQSVETMKEDCERRCRESFQYRPWSLDSLGPFLGKEQEERGLSGERDGRREGGFEQERVRQGSATIYRLKWVHAI